MNSHAQAEPIAASIVYQQKCASCHGTDGGGVQDRYEGLLYGEESIEELTQRIAETMPEDDPGACVGEEARAVAEYIYEEFYSLAARQRKGLAAKSRIELTRLTVPQYRNTVADLIASFTPTSNKDQLKQSQQGGLRGEYFSSNKMNKTENRKLVRVDPRIDFQFGKNSPAKGILRDQFTIIWQGSLIARNTGYYDFRIHTPNGARLYVNADSNARQDKLRDDSSDSIQSRLIDSWVSSGKMRTSTGRIFLLGGRRYPLRLEFFKYLDPTASLRLEWKPPHGVWSVLDESALSPKTEPRTFVVETPFPADDRSVGYERGTAISTEWHNAITNGALAAADEVVSRLALLTDTQTFYRRPKWEDKEVAAKKTYELAKKAELRRNAKLSEFLVQFASTAFRRPLTAAEDQLYRTVLFQDGTPELAVRRAVLLTLTSPYFLYTNLPVSETRSSSHVVAERLAFALWDSLPDAELKRVADLGRLTDLAQVESQAARMLDDQRARHKLQRFFHHWLELEERDLAKDQQLYPEFDEAVIADLRHSLELFVEQVAWSRRSDYRELLQADYLLLNDRLQQLYVGSAKKLDKAAMPKSQFANIVDGAQQRSGILTHPYLLSAFAYHDNTSPIHRGVFLTRNVVGRQLKPPPIAVAFENNNFSPHLTMREKVTELTSKQSCLSCHEVINPLGFALENFDAVGRWRTSENNRPIDTESEYTSAEGATLKIGSARDIARVAVASPRAHHAFIRQLFQHLVQQNPDAYGTQTLEKLHESFLAKNFHIRKLMVHIASQAAFHGPSPEIVAGNKRAESKK